MFKPLAVAIALLAAAPAQAGDVTAPVRDIMAVATAVWAGTDGSNEEYFAAPHLKSYSAGLRALYAEAIKHPAFDTDEPTGNPFDYDPIIGGQDGCALEDLSIKVAGTSGKVTDVVASFRRSGCFEGNSEAERMAVSEVHFSVIVEKGKPVIDDVIIGEGDDRSSLAETMTAIAGG